jgi:hypothetical protein
MVRLGVVGRGRRERAAGRKIRVEVPVFHLEWRILLPRQSRTPGAAWHSRLAAQRVSKRISHRSAVALPPRRLPEDAQSQKWPSEVNSALRTMRNLQLWMRMLTWLTQTEPRGMDRMANGERTRWKKQ